jgi:hypothetical protein
MKVTYPGTTATSTAMGLRFTGLPGTIMESRKVIPLYVAMAPIASASIGTGRVRIMAACSVGIEPANTLYTI